MGLGLSVCRAIVESHGGNINVGRQLGKGTTVTVTFSLAPGETQPLERGEPQPAR